MGAASCKCKPHAYKETTLQQLTWAAHFPASPHVVPSGEALVMAACQREGHTHTEHDASSIIYIYYIIFTFAIVVFM